MNRIKGFRHQIQKSYLGIAFRFRERNEKKREDNPNRKEKTEMMKSTKGISSVLAITFVVGLILSAPAAVFAQALAESVSRQVTEELNLTYDVIQVKRKAIVALNMGLTDYESKAFWPVYDEYWAEMKKVADRDVALISDFAKNYVYEGLTNQKADDMLKEWTSIKQHELKLQNKYMKKFRKVLPEKKVLRYFQIENKLNLLIDSELSANIPLAR
jgi:quinol monooxygenase YgiN